MIRFNSEENFIPKFMTEGDLFIEKTSPVFDSGMNDNKLLGMTGNVSEWCHDFYHAKFYRDNQNRHNPVAEAVFGKDTSYVRVLRGGSWEDAITRIRATYRQYSPPNCRSEVFGFRVVRRESKKK